MFRVLRYLFVLCLAAVLVVLALANRPLVTLHALPQEAEEFLGFTYAVDLPLFVVIFGAMGAGLVIGLVWEWLRESRYRSAARGNARKAAKLDREVQKLRGASPETKDEVLALIEDRT
ncbi:LapA family protein [Phaeovulum vinaykumarii]|uniref:Lipopolysaccharide assembly protein A domain-containing protein n=1 Tax=Phaeovulum vinaykumarii TaxID=407234 RepID=A0A1N7LML3_9RHOB|nr:LapA family protein [Phaeovulum vinaykumarii]SIS75083.1 Protein of unknown function [Phaeovulum vinaykumarii]SOC05502.1 uncharacterized protein DUF1049 [Phaeovulum vinaykumarii]